jgi:ADP-dependent NAD(P)H-hydrate dehydratase / NAD(P)H-hydrate epimerase
MKILTAAEMGATDRRTADEFNVSLSTLMENAGAAVAKFCLGTPFIAQQWVGKESGTPFMPQSYRGMSGVEGPIRALVLCGKGNNGGDGFVAARHLAKAGWSVTIALLGRMAEVKAGEAADALTQLRSEIPQAAVHEIADPAELTPLLNNCDLLIDAVVGTGFQPPLRGLAAEARDIVNAASIPVVAIDLPSGWDADSTAQTLEGAYRADAVVTFTAPKLAHMFGHLTSATFGPVVVAPIGSPAEAIQSASNLTWAGTSKSICEQPRNVNANKGRYGHVLVVGGSRGVGGAPSMASLAALRTGAGLVTAAVPESIAALVGAVTPELMVRPLFQGPEGSVALENLAEDKIGALLDRISVIALGPGLSQRGEASAFARDLVAKARVPMVIDADALNAFDNRANLLNGAGRSLVLTPHPGEMARLVGMTVKEVEADRVGLARRFATEHHLTLVLKGWRTLIAHPDGRIAVNTSGNPALAKGGSGDVLTGIIAAMLAQFPDDAARAVEAAVYLHGLAGDFAAHAMDERTVLATDTVAHLSDAFGYRATDANGYTWIAGLRQ